MGIGQNIYSIYSNRSYNCTVEMMGCANIMPMMYFQLNNIPMFKGVYMIINVKHSIRNGNMTTTFTGVRQTSIIYPFINSNLILTSMLERLNSTVNLTNLRRHIDMTQKDYTSETKNNPLVSSDSSVKVTHMSLLDNTSWVPKGNSKYPLTKFTNKRKITKIILHGTSGAHSNKGAAEICKRSWHSAWNKKTDYKASADFAVDDVNIVQFNPDLDYYSSWSTSNGKEFDRKGVSIEMCTTYDKRMTSIGITNAYPNTEMWSFTDKVLENTRQLIYMLFEKYGDMSKELPLEIVTHYKATGKSCPAVIGWNEGQVYNIKNEKIPNKFSTTEKFDAFLTSVKEGWKLKKNVSRVINIVESTIQTQTDENEFEVNFQ
jgi:hypothetical protein